MQQSSLSTTARREEKQSKRLRTNRVHPIDFYQFSVNSDCPLCWVVVRLAYCRAVSEKARLRDLLGSLLTAELSPEKARFVVRLAYRRAVSRESQTEKFAG